MLHPSHVHRHQLEPEPFTSQTGPEAGSDGQNSAYRRQHKGGDDADGGSRCHRYRL
jgi:hypothetical protein